MQIKIDFLTNPMVTLLLLFGLVGCDGSGSHGTGINSSTDTGGITDSNNSSTVLVPIVDASLNPVQDALPALSDGGVQRPLATTRYNGRKDSDFVSNELLLATEDETVLTDFLARWNGEILLVIAPSDDTFRPTPQYLVRIDTSLVDTSNFSEMLKSVAPTATGNLNISNYEGLKLITAAATERVAGLNVDINWLMSAETFNDRISLEGSASDAFNYSYMKTGGAQNSGVADAWLALERAGKLNNKVTVAVIDGGFAPNADFPTDTNYFARTVVPRNGRSVLTFQGGSDQASINFATNIPSPTLCSGGFSCPWHGTGAVGAIAGIADNGYGGAGSAGPIARVVTIHTAIDNASVLQALGFAASRAFIINMSFGGNCTSWCDWSLDNYSSFFQDVFRNGNLMFAGAGNGDNNRVGINVDAGENFLEDPNIHFPCETYGVTCIGALADNSNDKISYSNYSIGGSSNGLISNGGVRYFAPTNIKIGDYPNISAPQTFGGTSAASPFAAGIAALVKAADPSLTSQDIIAILDQTANTGSLDPNVGIWLNAKDAVLLALNEDSLPYMEIDFPRRSAFIETESVEFNATIDDLDNNIDDYNIDWSYENYEGTKIIIGSTKNGQSLRYVFCDGAYSINAKAFRASGPGTSEDIPITVTNPPTGTAPSKCKWSIDISEPTTDTVYIAGELINLRAIIDDDHPETDSPLAGITWRQDDASGPILDMGLLGSTKFSAGQHTIYAEYGDRAHDQVTITVVDLIGSAPEARFNSPESDNQLDWEDYYDVGSDSLNIPFIGLGVDDEDGTIFDSDSLQWSYREKDTVTWFVFANGTNITLDIPVVPVGQTFQIRLVVTDSNGNAGGEIADVYISGPAN